MRNFSIQSRKVVYVFHVGLYMLLKILLYGYQVKSEYVPINEAYMLHLVH
jgi:hypothetical protein